MSTHLSKQGFSIDSEFRNPIKVLRAAFSLIFLQRRIQIVTREKLRKRKAFHSKKLLIKF